jgi:hypothetical protein
MSPHEIQAPGESHKRQNTIFRTRGKLAIKKRRFLSKMEAAFTKALTGLLQTNFHTVTRVDGNVRQVLEFSECS